MLSLRANPKYVPGGVHNFWTLAPDLGEGQVLTSATQEMAGHPCTTLPPVVGSSLVSRFFTNPEAVKDMEKEAVGRSKERFEVGGPPRERLLVKEGWRLEEQFTLPNIFKFQQFTQFNDSY